MPASPATPSADGLSRLDWSLADHPDAAIVEMGSNDMLRGVSPAETEKNLRAMLTMFQKDHIPVMLIGHAGPSAIWGPRRWRSSTPSIPSLPRNSR